MDMAPAVISVDFDSMNAAPESSKARTPRTGHQSDAAPFGHRKHAWLDQVASDAAVSPFAFKLAYVIASRFLNSRSGRAWPTQETLARIMGATPRGVRKAIDQLEAVGHLASQRQRRRGAPNSYTIVEKGSDYRNHGSSNDEGDYRNGGSSNEPIRGTVVPPIPEPWFLQNPLNEPIEKEVSKNIRQNGLSLVVAETSNLPASAAPDRSRDRALLDDFESWWPVYPRRASKGQARKAYLSARKAKKATAEELMAGVTRYAASVAGREARYIKHPATWLNGECWGDELEQASAGFPPRRTLDRSTGMESALAGIMKAGGMAND